MIDVESAQLFFLGRVFVHSPSLYFYRTSAYVEKLQNLVHHHLPSNFLIVLGHMPPHENSERDSWALLHESRQRNLNFLRKAPQCAETLECKNNDRYKYFYSSIELIHILWINISRKQGLHFDEATWVISSQSSDHTLTHPQQGAITHALIARKLGSHNNSTFRTMTISVIYGIVSEKSVPMESNPSNIHTIPLVFVNVYQLQENSVRK